MTTKPILLLLLDRLVRMQTQCNTSQPFHKPKAPIVGDLVDRDEIKKWSNSPRKFMEWLRSVTLGLHSNYLTIFLFHLCLLNHQQSAPEVYALHLQLPESKGLVAMLPRSGLQFDKI